MPLREAREKTKFVRSNDKTKQPRRKRHMGDIMNIKKKLYGFYGIYLKDKIHGGT